MDKSEDSAAAAAAAAALLAGLRPREQEQQQQQQQQQRQLQRQLIQPTPKTVPPPPKCCSWGCLVGWYRLLSGWRSSRRAIRLDTPPPPPGVVLGRSMKKTRQWTLQPGDNPFSIPTPEEDNPKLVRRNCCHGTYPDPTLPPAEYRQELLQYAESLKFLPPLPPAAKIAARQDDAESINVVEGMLQKPINGLDEQGRSLLFYAVRGVRNDSGELEPPGGSLAAAHPISRAKLLSSIEAGGAARHLVLKKGANPNLPALGHGKITPLMEAARFGHLAAVKTLLAVKADPSLRDDEGLTALQIAQTQLPLYLSLEEANCSANQWGLVKANIQHDRDRVVEFLLQHEEDSRSSNGR